jgi:hypothetical protein
MAVPVSWRFVVDGSDHDLVANGVLLQTWTPFARDGQPALSWVVPAGSLQALPDPYLGKSIAWYTTDVDSVETLRFVGDCIGVSEGYDPELGWVRTYQAAGLGMRSNLIPVTNPTDSTDRITFNDRPGSSEYRESLAGRTVGEILKYVLEAAEIATALDAAGIGGYSDLPSSPATATATVSSNAVSAVAVDSGGGGYADAPAVLFLGGGGSGARARATVSAGAVTAITILDGGSGYLSGAVSVTFRGGGGTGATAGSITVTSGEVTAIAVSAGGSGYSVYAPPEVVITWADSTPAAHATVTAGAVTAITVDDGGAGYTSAPEVWISPLPLATLQDLAKLTVIPTSPISVGGENVLQALANVLSSCQPNHWLHVEPDGTIRVYDQTAWTTVDLTMDSSSQDPTVDVAGVQLSRSIQGCAGRVVVRGGPDVTASWLTLAGGSGTTSITSTVQASPTPTTTGFAGGSGLSASNDTYNGWVCTFTSGVNSGVSRIVDDYVGSTKVITLVSALPSAPSSSDAFRLRTKGARLLEYFDWGGETDETTIKAAWTLGDFTDLSSNAQDSGACTCPSVLTVTITTSKTYGSNELDQTSDGRKAVVILTDNLTAGIGQTYTAKVTSNSGTGGGTCTLTLDRELPATTFDSYKLYLESQEGAVVWRRYWPEDEAIRAAIGTYFPFPVPVAGDGDAAGSTSYPIMVLTKGALTAVVPCRVDPDNGWFVADRPTVTFFGSTIATGSAAAAGNVPDDVQVLAAIVNGSLTATVPPDNAGAVYTGQVYAETGRVDTVYVTVPSWIDKANQAAMLDYAWQLLDTVKDPIIEGTVPLMGWGDQFYSPGKSIQLKGDGYSTTYQYSAVPVIGVDVALTPSPVLYRTQLRVSSQRQAFAAAQFERPLPRGLEIGGGGFEGAATAGVSAWAGFTGAIGGPQQSTAFLGGPDAATAAWMGGSRTGGPTMAQRSAAHTVGPFDAGRPPSMGASEQYNAMSSRPLNSPGGPTMSASQAQNAAGGLRSYAMDTDSLQWWE